MEEIKYSIIIPIYNSKNTIARCIDSIINQTYTNYELILVNDGSTDESGQICEEYQKKYPQICYYNQQNLGVSSARNLGLRHAKGTYIMFVDSDDYVCDNYFSIIDKYINDDTQFLMFNQTRSECCKISKRIGKTIETNQIEDTIKLLSKSLRKQLLNSVWNKVYRRDIIEQNKICFNESIYIGEDKVFVVEYVTHIDSIIIIEDSLYIVSTENEESLSRKKREDLCEQILTEYDLLFGIVCKISLPEKLKKQIEEAIEYSYYRSTYSVMNEIYKFDYLKKQRYERMRQVCENYEMQHDLSLRDFKTKFISIPVRKKWIRLVDFILIIKKSVRKFYD